MAVCRRQETCVSAGSGNMKDVRGTLIRNSISKYITKDKDLDQEEKDMAVKIRLKENGRKEGSFLQNYRCGFQISQRRQIC